jgi:hypothetical protein
MCDLFGLIRGNNQKLTNKTIESELDDGYSPEKSGWWMRWTDLDSQSCFTHPTITQNCYPPVIHFWEGIGQKDEPDM